MLKVPFKTAKYRCVHSVFDLSYSVPLIFSLLQNSSCLASALRFLEAVVFFIRALFPQEEQIGYLKNKSSSLPFPKSGRIMERCYAYSVLLLSVTFLSRVSWEALRTFQHVLVIHVYKLIADYVTQ